MPIILTPKEMATITNGKWENLSENLYIEEVEYIFHYLKKNDLFIVRQSTYDRLNEAIEKGIAAAIIDGDYVVTPNLPVLRVENTYTAFRSLALASRQKSQCKTVLVTGSYGKTGFKNHLYTVIKDQFNTYTRHSSANRVRSTYCNMLSLKPEHELLIIEQPVTKRSRMLRRAEYVSPDICVITSIGHEHIERFDSIKNIIEIKTQIAKALKPGGKFLIPRDDPYYHEIRKTLSQYKHCNILTFGSRSSCNARILYRHYREYGWDVVAKIEDSIVAYHVPFPEYHEPASSLAVLLSVYHLGGNVHDAAEKFYMCKNFVSSGIIYRATYMNRPFILYDQSHRGGMEGYAQFFKSLSTIQTKGKGRKILITSAFVDDEDNEIELLDIPHLKRLMSEAGIDLLYTVEEFLQHKSVVPDNILWKKHVQNPLDLQEDFPHILQENDLLCIKGIFESELPKLVKALTSDENIDIKPLQYQDTMRQINLAIKGLKPITFEDKEHFMHAVALAKKNNWISFFPFLLFWSFSSKRELLIEEIDGSISIYLFRHFNKNEPPSLQLLMPPMPMSENAMKKAFSRISNMYENAKASTILWIEEHEKKMIAQMTIDTATIDMKSKKSDEFLFSPSRYNDLGGKSFRHLRQNLHQLSKYNTIHIETYSEKHYDSCMALLQKWENLQRKKYRHLEDSSYTKHCLAYADRFNQDELFGIVLFIDNDIVAFGFAGMIRQEVGSLFIGKYDPTVKGAFDYMKLHLLLRMGTYRYANDSYALSEGMAFSKRMFRPVKMLKQYSAKIERKHKKDES